MPSAASSSAAGRAGIARARRVPDAVPASARWWKTRLTMLHGLNVSWSDRAGDPSVTSWASGAQPAPSRPAGYPERHQTARKARWRSQLETGRLQRRAYLEGTTQPQTPPGAGPRLGRRRGSDRQAGRRQCRQQRPTGGSLAERRPAGREPGAVPDRRAGRAQPGAGHDPGLVVALAAVERRRRPDRPVLHPRSRPRHPADPQRDAGAAAPAREPGRPADQRDPDRRQRRGADPDGRRSRS